MDVLRGFALSDPGDDIQLFATVEAATNNPTAYGDLTGRKFPRVVLFSFARGSELYRSSRCCSRGIVLCGRRRKVRAPSRHACHSASRLDASVRCSARTLPLVWRHSFILRNVRAVSSYLFRTSKSPRTLISSALVLAAIGSLIAIGLGLLLGSALAADIQGRLHRGWQASPHHNEELAA